jgi:hypothetical protein
MAKKPEGKNEKESDNEKIKMQKNYAWYEECKAFTHTIIKVQGRKMRKGVKVLW